MYKQSVSVLIQKSHVTFLEDLCYRATRCDRHYSHADSEEHHLLLEYDQNGKSISESKNYISQQRLLDSSVMNGEIA